MVTAKHFGIKVTEFFVGFGPRLWSFRRGETEYGDQGDPGRRLRQDHRDDRPRGDRPGGRAAGVLPQAGLAAGRHACPPARSCTWSSACCSSGSPSACSATRCADDGQAGPRVRSSPASPTVASDRVHGQRPGLAGQGRRAEGRRPDRVRRRQEGHRPGPTSPTPSGPGPASRSRCVLDRDRHHGHRDADDRWLSCAPTSRTRARRSRSGAVGVTPLPTYTQVRQDPVEALGKPLSTTGPDDHVAAFAAILRLPAKIYQVGRGRSSATPSATPTARSASSASARISGDVAQPATCAVRAHRHDPACCWRASTSSSASSTCSRCCRSTAATSRCSRTNGPRAGDLRRRGEPEPPRPDMNKLLPLVVRGVPRVRRR